MDVARYSIYIRPYTSLSCITVNLINMKPICVSVPYPARCDGYREDLLSRDENYQISATKIGVSHQITVRKLHDKYSWRGNSPDEYHNKVPWLSGQIVPLDDVWLPGQESKRETCWFYAKRLITACLQECSQSRWSVGGYMILHYVSCFAVNIPGNQM